MTIPWNPAAAGLAIDRSRAVPLTQQIATALRSAIVEGRLRPGARLPSWLDMAAQLGVSRGTVKAAYETLVDEMLVFSAGAAGTRVADRPAPRPVAVRTVEIACPLQDAGREFGLRPLPFQIGVPAQDAFPAKLWARLRTRAVRANAIAPVTASDPRGTPELRAQIAAQLAITRGIRCLPDQIILTSGYRGGLGLALSTLGMAGRRAWVEDPGCPVTRKALRLAGVDTMPVPVDAQGLRVDRAVHAAPDAALAIVTSGLQGPGGAALSAERRAALLAWAERNGGWIVEHDQASELLLDGRAPPAIAANDPAGRVIHIGSFDMTISGALGLGYLVAPIALAAQFAEVAAHLNPAPNPVTQLALADFLGDGHFLRHIRHMKALYRERRDMLARYLGNAILLDQNGGLAAIMPLPAGTDDVALAAQAPALGIAPAPLSLWSADPGKARPGLVLGITNMREPIAAKACEALARLIDCPAEAPLPARAA
jgi:GntR family transcriptional regulator/MocR family aminotransferase